MTTQAHTPWGRLVGVGTAVAAIATLLALAFLWPSATSKAQNLPIALAGPPAATAQLEQALEHSAPGVFDVVDAPDRAAAANLIDTRDVYGAIVLGAQPEILTASASSTLVAQQLAALSPVLAERLAGSGSAGPVGVPVTDVAPLSQRDPHGTILSLVTLPLVIGGMIGGIAISLFVVGVWRRVASVGVYAAAAGLAVAGVLQGVFGALDGAYLVNAGIIALTLAAIAGVIVGTVSIIGPVGIAVGPVLFLLVANPIASSAAPWQMLPAPWGAIGQWLPPGAAGALLRDHSYFPQADSAAQWLALAGWVVLGLVLATVGHFKNSGGATVAAIEEAQAEAQDEADARQGAAIS